MDGTATLDSLLPALVVESDPLVRRAVSALAAKALGSRVVSVAGTGEAAVVLAGETFGLVIFDGPNTAVLEIVAGLLPSPNTILLASELHPRAVLGAIRQGVGGVISRHGDPYLLVPRIRAAYTGGLYLDEVARAALLAGGLPAGVPDLSHRERQVLEALAEGHSLLAIARSLGMSLSTAKSHAAKASAKLGTSNSRRAAAMARELGLLDAAGLHPAAV